MEEADFASLSQGVFVIPHERNYEGTPSSEAGPSRVGKTPRKLRKLYERDCKRVQAAQAAYEQNQVDAQLDDIRGWLDACDRPPLLKLSSRTKRLRIAVLQSTFVAISSHLVDLAARTFTLHGREVTDVSGAIRDIAIGLSDGAIAYSKTSGAAGLTALERHTSKQKTSSHLLLHIAHAQALPQNTLSELLYILSRHSLLPVRVVLSVPSASLFVSSLQHVDPTTVDVSILRPIAAKRRAGVVESLHHGDLMLVSQARLEDLHAKENQTGGGVMAASKALKWLQLRASESSRLVGAVESDDLASLQAIGDASRAANEGPLAELLDPDAEAALEASLDPAPRISILKALSDYQLFLKVMGEEEENSHLVDANETGSKNGLDDKGGSLDEIRRLFELYASAGRTVNLWDWLQGFEKPITRAKPGQANGEEANGEKHAGHSGGSSAKRKRQNGASDEEGEVENGIAGSGEDEVPKIIDEREQDRLHSTFIRFCEEARMMGLLRARGRAKADEVVKGIGFV